MPRHLPATSLRILALIAAAGAASTAAGQVFQWTGAVDNIWNMTTPNWSGQSTNVWVNSATSHAQFTSPPSQVDITTPISLNRLSVSGGNSFFVGPGGGRMTLEGTDPTVWTAADTQLSMSCLVYGSNGFTKSGPGRLWIGNYGWRYQGPTRVLEGELYVSAQSDMLPLNNDMHVAPGAMLTCHGYGTNPPSTQHVGALTGQGTIRKLGDNTPVLVVRGADPAPTFSGAVRGVDIRKEGPATQILTAQMIDGSIASAADGLLLLDLTGQTNPSFGFGAPAGSTGTIGLRGGVTIANTASAITGHGAPGRRGVIDNLSGHNTLTGPIMLSGDASIGVSADSLTFTGFFDYSLGTLFANPEAGTTLALGPIWGNQLAKRGPGTLTLTGNTSIINTLFLEQGTVLLHDPITFYAGRIAFNSGSSGLLRLNGCSINVRGLSGGDGGSFIDNWGNGNPGTINLQMVDFGSETFSGYIWEGLGGQVSLTKSGDATQVFTRNQGYSGPTTVNAGWLVTASLASAQVAINGGALQTSGNLKAVTLSGGWLISAGSVESLSMSGGALRPAGEGLGTISVSNGLTATGGTIELHIQGTEPSTAHDRIQVNAGNVQLGEGLTQLTFPSPQGDFAETEQLYIIINNGSGALSGWFADLPDNGDAGTEVPALAGLGGHAAWRIYYHADSAAGTLVGGNDVAIAPARSCLADFNNSGAPSVQDIFDFLAAYFANDPRTDINNSGTVSVQDIFDFLAAYFAGCN